MQGLREKIVAAYLHLTRTKGTAFPSIADLLDKSGVARSTLYKHFDDRSSMLVAVMQGPFAILATAAENGCVEPRLVALLEHFWEERRGVLDLLATPHVNRLAKGLSIELELRVSGLRQADAVRIAHSQITFLRLWINGETNCMPAEMSKIFAASSFALVAAARANAGGCGDCV